VIRSEEEFLGSRFAAPYYETKRQTWTALAYIDKAEASRTYESKITVNMTSINAMAADAAQTVEPLQSCGLLFRAARVGDITEEYIKTAAVIDPSSTAKYSPYLAHIQNVRSQYRAKRDGLTFRVISTQRNSAERNGRIERKIQELLEANGCIVTAQSPLYEVQVILDMAEENQPPMIFIRSGISIFIVREDNDIFSYSKNYQRNGSQNRDNAYNRAFIAIEKDLEENFMVNLAALIGR
jgi:hypothetical protein